MGEPFIVLVLRSVGAAAVAVAVCCCYNMDKWIWIVGTFLRDFEWQKKKMLCIKYVV